MTDGQTGIAGIQRKIERDDRVLRKHNITRGVSPEKLRLILEDLGPTFIKLGQIMSMHSDILPKRYCDELMRLRSEVAPMSFSEVGGSSCGRRTAVHGKRFLKRLKNYHLAQPLSHKCIKQS